MELMDRWSRCLNKVESAVDIIRLRTECKKFSNYGNSISILSSYFPFESETCLISHLIVSSGSTEQAIKRIEAMLQWRQQSFPYTISPFICNTKSSVFYTYGYDTLQHPLIIFRTPLSNVKTRNIEEMLRIFIFIVEVAMQRLPPGVLQFSMLMDREGMQFKPDYEFYQRAGKILNLYYPCMLYKVYVYPVNYAVRSMWEIAKRVLPNRAKSIVKPISTLDKLRQCIPDMYIPQHLGGSCEYQFNPNDYPNPFVEPKSTYTPLEANRSNIPALDEAAVTQLYNDMYTSVESLQRIKQSGVARSHGYDYMRDEINTRINQESVARSYNYQYMKEKYYGDISRMNGHFPSSTILVHVDEEDDAWSEVTE